MNSQLTVLSDEQVAQVSGGHAVPGMGVFGMILLILEIPHAIVGIIEFTNYVGERWENGCQNIEEGDHFTSFFCRA